MSHKTRPCPHTDSDGYDQVPIRTRELLYPWSGLPPERLFIKHQISTRLYKLYLLLHHQHLPVRGHTGPQLVQQVLSSDTCCPYVVLPLIQSCSHISSFVSARGRLSTFVVGLGPWLPVSTSLGWACCKCTPGPAYLRGGRSHECCPILFWEWGKLPGQRLVL